MCQRKTDRTIVAAVPAARRAAIHLRTLGRASTWAALLEPDMNRGSLGPTAPARQAQFRHAGLQTVPVHGRV